MRLEKTTIDLIKSKLREFLRDYNGEVVAVRSERNQGINPLTTPAYLQKAFPHLFPHGEMRIDNDDRDIPINQIDFIRHVIALEDQRFCRDPVLPYVLMDLKAKFQNKKLTAFFISSNPVESGYSTEQLLQLPEGELLKKLYPCLHPVLGSAAYYKDKRKKLK